MIDTNVTHVISQQVLESTAQDMTGKYVWMFLAGLVVLIFKSSIEKLAAALFMFIGSDYKEDDVVYVDGKPGRIIRVGLTKTVFFIYDVVDGKVVSGNKLVVQNERLASLNITAKTALKYLDEALVHFNPPLPRPATARILSRGMC